MRKITYFLNWSEQPKTLRYMILSWSNKKNTFALIKKTPYKNNKHRFELESIYIDQRPITNLCLIFYPLL